MKLATYETKNLNEWKLLKGKNPTAMYKSHNWNTNQKHNLCPSTYDFLSEFNLSTSTLDFFRLNTTREKPSSRAGFRYISSAGARATDTALQLTGSSSAGATRATTTSVSSCVDTTRATTN